MSDNISFEVLDELVEREIDRGTFPGAVVLVKKGRKTIKHEAYGNKSELPSKERMSEDTIFDLASLTKAVVTTTLALRLIERGAWKLSDPISKYYNEFKNPNITLKHLLTHTSGLIPWIDLFSDSKNREEAIEKLLTDKWPILTPVVPPMQEVIYSDLNFIILGLAIEKVCGKALEELAREEIFLPLEMKDTFFNPPENLIKRIAPTEKHPAGDGFIRGKVHDENCRALGGVSGHAGLFSTAVDLGKFVGALLNKGSYKDYKLLGRATVEKLETNFTKGLDGSRSLGWKLSGEGSPSSGDILSSSSFGHTGFTGGSIWMDPIRDMGTIVLTNRVHPDRSRGAEDIQDFRARVNNVILGELQ